MTLWLARKTWAVPRNLPRGVFVYLASLSRRADGERQGWCQSGAQLSREPHSAQSRRCWQGEVCFLARPVWILSLVFRNFPQGFLQKQKNTQKKGTTKPLWIFLFVCLSETHWGCDRSPHAFESGMRLPSDWEERKLQGRVVNWNRSGGLSFFF